MLLLSWAKAGRHSEGRGKATRSEGDDLEESAARALMRHGEDVVGEVIALAQVRGLANSLDYDTGEIPNWWD